MIAVERVEGRAYPLGRSNVDTDVIIAAEHLKTIARAGLGRHAFETIRREPGCSMCLAMNPDKVPPRERCASTSNRNFVGRQGPGARTHLLSPAMAAAAAVKGRLADVRELVG